MARSKVDNSKESTTDWRPQRRWMSGGVAQVVVLVNGLILSFAAFIILNMFIQGMMKEDLKRLIWDTHNKVEKDIGSLENVLRSASTILITSRPLGDEAVRKNILYGVPALDRFERVFWLRRKDGAPPPGSAPSDQWQLLEISKQPLTNEMSAGTAISDQALTEHILRVYNKKNERIIMSSEIPGTKYIQETVQPIMRGRPFVLVQTMLPGTKSETIVVGMSRPSRILDREWLDNRIGIRRMAIRQIEFGYSLFFMDRSGNGREEALNINNSQVHEISIGEEKWRLLVDVGVEEASQFLLKTPMVLLLFGLGLTIVGTLYVRNNQKQSSRMAGMNKALAQKNYELNSEVSERERLNSTLRKAEREYRAIIDAVSDIIFETNTNGEILFLNGTWRKVTGFEADQAMARNLFDLLHPQDQEEQRTFFEQLVKGQKHAYRVFTRLRTSDGTFRSVELAMSMIRQDENKNLRVVGTFTDVEERRRAERALSEAEKKYRTIVENAAGGIYQLTPSGQFLSANPAMARILDYDSPDHLLREVRNAHSMLYVNQKERMRFVRELETLGVVKNFELEVATRNGEKIWVNENARAVKDDEGNILYFEGSMENVTQRKLAEMKLREAKVRSDLANRAKSEFLGNMGHELRTPLNAIIGFSEIIKDEVLGKMDNRQYWEYARDIYDSGRNLLNIINEILDVSRIEAGERQLNEGIVNIDKLVKACIGFVQPKAEAGNLTLTNMMDGTVPNLIAEELAIKQILLNLLSNAIKFTPEGGRVTLAHEVDSEGMMRISVTDTGIGLDEAEIEKALSPFGQIETSLNRTGSGAGLGLTLADSLMKLHGGKLELFSQKGIGTTATIIFPARRVTQEQGSRRWQEKTH
ncbi:MAG: PAS domain-containing sensor histidine kinase [Alphaproteobacteria bacterium]|nr:PAS domain-containing sensor histidine kinase [Alphaproteobacteria bacterium]